MRYQLRDYLIQRWRSKYGAQPTEVDGIRFHSRAEARRYQELLLLQKAGEIVSEIERQPPFPLYMEDCYHADVNHYVCTYLADFHYTRKDGELVWEDLKGFDTPMSKLKRRMVSASYGIEIQIVR